MSLHSLETWLFEMPDKPIACTKPLTRRVETPPIHASWITVTSAFSAVLRGSRKGGNLERAVPPPPQRYGKVFVASVEAARGLSFEVVFVPGCDCRSDSPQKRRLNIPQV